MIQLSSFYETRLYSIFKLLWPYIILLSLGCSLLLTILAPIEIYKTINGKSWQPRKVRIIHSELELVRGKGKLLLNIALYDLESKTTSSTVFVRFGDIEVDIHLPFMRSISSKRRDSQKYIVGKELIAYKNPKSNEYLLEQNSITLMITLLLLSISILTAISFRIWWCMQEPNRCVTKK